MTIPMEPRTPRLYHVREGSAASASTAFSAGGAVGIVCAATATMLVGSIIAASLGAPVMVTAAIGQVLLVAVPLAVLRGVGMPLAAVGLRRARALRHYAAALLFGASAWYLNMWLVHALPIRGEDTQLVQLVDRPSTAVVLLVVAVAPAVCEEVLFRGVLVRGLATRFYPAIAVLAGALVFALYHLRVVQLVPTFTLGLLLGYLALASGSVLPGMLAHLTNNTIALLVARGEAPGIARAFGGHPRIAIGGCLVAVALGIALAYERRRGAA